MNDRTRSTNRPVKGAGAILIAALSLACAEGEPFTAPPGNGGAGDVELTAQPVVEGLTSPVHLAAPPGDDRLFVVERRGTIRIVENGQLLADPFLDIVPSVDDDGSEQGLLSVAFHPDFAENGRFYVDYTNNFGNTRVVEYTVSGSDPGRADPATADTILRVEQPFSNHNGGLVTFGPDGMLYVGLGDGGGSGDPEENGQDSTTVLGSILRLDVDGAVGDEPYAVPLDNPFVGRTGADEIWAYGLRNPWRFSFDPASGRLFIADVGQDSFEEIDAVDASEPGLNFGWNVMEGAHCFPEGSSCSESGLVLPVVEYENDTDACSVTGGFAYRGTAIPELQGHYFFSDFCAGFVRSFRMEGGQAVDQTEWALGDLGSVTSFGVDDAGALYVVVQEGTVYRIVEAG